MATEGSLIIFSGPSGVGKDTLLEAWSACDPRVQRVVAYTTRQPRAGEVDGVDYNFVTPARFHALAAEGAFLEYKEVHGNFYATPLRDMEALLREGKLAILKIDVQGAMDAIRLRPDAATVFVLPPSFEELERRIRSRGTDSPETILKRLENARGELALADRYAHPIVNDALERAVGELLTLFPPA